MSPESQVKHDLKKALSLVGVSSRALSVGFGGERGMPDRMAIVRGHAVYFEAKRAGKAATPKQQQIHAELRVDGATVFMVWPYNIQEVVRLTVELRDYYISRGLGFATTECLFPVPAQPKASTRRNQKRSPARPTLSRGADNPEQHSFALAIGYQRTEQD